MNNKLKVKTINRLEELIGWTLDIWSVHNLLALPIGVIGDIIKKHWTINPPVKCPHCETSILLKPLSKKDIIEYYDRYVSIIRNCDECGKKYVNVYAHVYQTWDKVL